MDRRSFIKLSAAAGILPMIRSNSEPIAQSNYDLIIVGAGSAGMPCAIFAAQRGLKVAVVEKEDKIGGTLHYSHGQMSAAGTKLQRDRGIDDHPDLHFEDIMRISDYSADPLLARLAVDTAPALIQWLDELGMPWHENSPAHVYAHRLYSVPRTYYGPEAGLSILKTMQKSWDEQLTSGGISFFPTHKLISLVGDANGVHGVVCETLQGLVQLEANKIVLTTGGYASNHDFHQKVTGDGVTMISSSNPTSMGEGAEAAMKVGAQFHNGEKLALSLGGIITRPESGRADAWDAWARLTTPIMRPVSEIYVTAKGKRFMAEDEPDPDKREKTVFDLPDRKFWLIFDQESFEYAQSPVVQWDKNRLLAEAEKGISVWKADSIDELATKAGIDPKGLVDTVDAFNDYAISGSDKEFGRSDFKFRVAKPPYYAILTHAISLLSFGGLKVDKNLQVQNEFGNPINGLYAAGEILGAATTSGKAFCGGMLLTPALAFGKWLGERL